MILSDNLTELKMVIRLNHRKSFDWVIYRFFIVIYRSLIVHKNLFDLIIKTYLI